MHAMLMEKKKMWLIVIAFGTRPRKVTVLFDLRVLSHLRPSLPQFMTCKLWDELFVTDIDPMPKMADHHRLF